MKTLKPKNIEVIEPVKKTVELTDIEKAELDVKTYEDGIANSRKVLEQNQDTLDKAEENHGFSLQSLELDRRLANIIRANPLKYDESEEYSDYVKDLQDFYLETYDFKLGLVCDAYDNKIEPILTQIKRINKDIPEQKMVLDIAKSKLDELKGSST